MLRHLLLTCQIWCFAGRVCHPSSDLFLLSKPLQLTDFVLSVYPESNVVCDCLSGALQTLVGNLVFYAQSTITVISG